MEGPDSYDNGYNEGRAETILAVWKAIKRGDDLELFLKTWEAKVARLGNWPEGVNRLRD